MTLPKDAALVAIVRGARVITPSGEEPLEPGDELLFVALPEAEEALHKVVLGDRAHRTDRTQRGA
jgi:trk system potassium uptake protein TrkA